MIIDMTVSAMEQKLTKKQTECPKPKSSWFHFAATLNVNSTCDVAICDCAINGVNMGLDKDCVSTSGSTSGSSNGSIEFNIPMIFNSGASFGNSAGFSLSDITFSKTSPIVAHWQTSG